MSFSLTTDNSVFGVYTMTLLLRVRAMRNAIRSRVLFLVHLSACGEGIVVENY